MQIKTLAQILAENEKGEKTSSNNQSKSGQAKSKSTPTQTVSRAQISSARDFSVSKPQDNKSSYPITSNSKKAYSKKSNSKQSDTDYEPKLDGSPASSSLFEDTADKQITRPKKRKKKSFHPASPYQPKTKLIEPVKEVDPNSIKSLLAQVKAEAEQREQTDSPLAEASTDASIQTYSQVETDNSGIDNLPAALKAYLKTSEQRQAEKEEIKANSRLRWLAFYYLSRREHSAGELRQKLLEKEQDPDKIEELLQEFAEKGYQSDHRTALMLIREGIRKGRGRLRIKNDFYKRKVEVPANIDELIDMAMEDNEEFVDMLSNHDLVDGVDWLRLAVEARVKKYGSEIPTEPKIKARQLRFLQYRGFKPDICFQAITHNLESLEERF
ncbi:regulatory protein RecX [Psychrobacter piechaudii]|uniref:Regulatory protein RecX n=1 Tax=Psychrobacter piechaudii TaxID=1945521 RepID=A0A1R4G8W4_9GAMM|nr:regulatory protein RecX [Psychrobacter piechaudii]SJM64596.1 Regulatory protein RecX [Psychrobacter piechaudii]